MLNDGILIHRNKRLPVAMESGHLTVVLSDANVPVLNLTGKPVCESDLATPRALMVESNGDSLLVRWVPNVTEHRLDRLSAEDRNRSMLNRVKTRTEFEDGVEYEVVFDTPTHTESWYVDHKLSRGGDRPAVIQGNNFKAWYKNGKLHRDGDKPAYIHQDGILKYYKNGELHRDGNQPAVIDRTTGTMEYYVNGKKQPNPFKESTFNYVMGMECDRMAALMESELGEPEDDPQLAMRKNQERAEQAEKQSVLGQSRNPRTAIRRMMKSWSMRQSSAT